MRNPMDPRISLPGLDAEQALAAGSNSHDWAGPVRPSFPFFLFIQTPRIRTAT